MGFKDAVRTVFNKYVVIEGRAPRSEYWWFVLFAVLASFVLGIVDAAIFGIDGMTPLSTLFSLAILIPSITVGVRRLHDRDMSGWWMLLMLLPLIGMLILLVIFVMKGTDGSNRFGPDPLGVGGDDNAVSSVPPVRRD